MKIIVITPILNEAWILPFVLKNFSSFADHIIIADQNSTDESREVCKKFEKVKVINNPYKGYTNEVRFMLLDEARKIEGEGNLIVQLDADEFIHPSFINEIKDFTNKNAEKKSVAFSSEWLQMYNSDTTHRVDGVWKNNYKAFAFIDYREIDYDRNYITNEHINRIPDIKKIIRLHTPILHVQYLAQKRCEIKQAVYMCTERSQGINPRKTNNRYSITKFLKNIPVEKLEEKFYAGILFPGKESYNTYDEDKLKIILSLFKVHGSLFFEPLEIWHIDELKKIFTEENKRPPEKIKVFPKWIISLNNLRNKIKYKLFY
jgi:GTP:adenosylcobinamide-phosphate guanylyltransferase